jgi:hypothetical protein
MSEKTSARTRSECDRKAAVNDGMGSGDAPETAEIYDPETKTRSLTGTV